MDPETADAPVSEATSDQELTERMRRRLALAVQATSRVQLSRGRGAHARAGLIQMLSRGDGDPERTMNAIGELIESLVYAVEDAKMEAAQNLRVTSRTIAAAMHGR